MQVYSSFLPTTVPIRYFEWTTMKTYLRLSPARSHLGRGCFTVQWAN
jgi:hypothetical protein